MKAEGDAQALQTVFGAAQQVDAKTMTLQVIEGMKAIGSGPSNTFIIPMELTRLLGQVGGFLEQGFKPVPEAESIPARLNGEVASLAESS